MISESSLVGFIPSMDLIKAKSFYTQILGLLLDHEDDYALEFNVRGCRIRINKVNEKFPVPYTVLGWSVMDIGTTVSELIQKGIQFEKFDGLNQRENGICTFPDGSQVAWFKDPDDNILSITQY